MLMDGCNNFELAPGRWTDAPATQVISTRIEDFFASRFHQQPPHNPPAPLAALTEYINQLIQDRSFPELIMLIYGHQCVTTEDLIIAIEYNPHLVIANDNRGQPMCQMANRRAAQYNRHNNILSGRQEHWQHHRGHKDLRQAIHKAFHKYPFAMLLQDIYKEVQLYLWNHPKQLSNEHIPITPTFDNFLAVFNNMDLTLIEREDNQFDDLSCYWFYTSHAQ